MQYLKGVNALRTFKTITADKKIQIRKPNFDLGQALLRAVIDKSKAGRGLDNINLEQAMQLLATSYQRAGNQEAAEAIERDIAGYFSGLSIKQYVKEYITRQSATVLAADR
ncbi:hypothetical protein [Paraflavitalea speifideaquila]|uniref:hypothetical protein n=1 Tax=Paraflavitalea speifideaquila TaxID=3076558 RepID=UPI0028E7539F|nr:hypothetical protein [Paraflavitalea speifideiaquila]